MADNISITAGSGTPVRTDEIGGIHYQFVKLADGTDGQSTAAIVDAHGQLRVQPFHTQGFRTSHDEVGAVTDHEIQAAPAAGLSLYVTDVWISNDATLAVTVKLIEDTAAAKTALTHTIQVAASSSQRVSFATPLKLTAAKNLGMTTTGVSNFGVTVTGFTAA